MPCYDNEYESHKLGENILDICTLKRVRRYKECLVCNDKTKETEVKTAKGLNMPFAEEEIQTAKEHSGKHPPFTTEELRQTAPKGGKDELQPPPSFSITAERINIAQPPEKKV